METKHKPAKALPWSASVYTQRVIAPDGIPITNSTSDAAYIAHAANAYPQLVAALRDLREAALLARTGAEMSYGAVQRADEVLCSLGEME